MINSLEEDQKMRCFYMTDSDALLSQLNLVLQLQCIEIKKGKKTLVSQES